MESFVLFAGASDPKTLAGRIDRALTGVVPRAGAPLVTRSWSLEEISGFLVCVGPEADEFRSLISVHSALDYLVVVYGNISGRTEPARVIHDLVASADGSWRSSVRALDGSFTAIVVDKRRRAVEVVTDLIGCRALSWHDAGGQLSLSPHAIGLLSTGAVPLRWDPNSVASAVCVDWSVGRRPFLTDLRTLKPYETLTWESGRTRVESSSPIAFDSRISRFDTRALAEHGESLTNAMVEGTRSFCEGRTRITVSLTAGLDSRATLGLLHAAGAKQVLHTQTNGLPGSADVEGASRLAAICGVPHTRNDPAAASSTDFAANARLTAFLSNGDANAKQCLSRLPKLTYSGSVGGAGGEIYTGFYYPPFLPFGHIPDDPARVSDTFMTRMRKGRWSALGAWGSPLQQEAQQRLAQELTTFRDLGARGGDLADLLYLWERYGHWGSLAYRRPWSHGWTPFATAGAVRGLFRYPREAGKYCDVHVRIIRKYLPTAAYLMPVNGSILLPLVRPGHAGYMLRQAQLAFGMIQKKARAKLRTRASEAGIEQVWAGMFANEIHDLIRSLLTDPRSLALAAFGAKAIEALLDNHRLNRGQLQPLGALVMAEQFRLLAEETVALSNQA